MADTSQEHDAKRKKQLKRMTKILSKAWSIDRAEPFQEVEDDHLRALLEDGDDSDGPIDLMNMGQKLDNGIYPHGKKGWDKFAAHLGGVYNRFIGM